MIDKLKQLDLKVGDLFMTEGSSYLKDPDDNLFVFIGLEASRNGHGLYIIGDSLKTHGRFLFHDARYLKKVG